MADMWFSAKSASRAHRSAASSSSGRQNFVAYAIMSSCKPSVLLPSVILISINIIMFMIIIIQFTNPCNLWFVGLSLPRVHLPCFCCLSENNATHSCCWCVLLLSLIQRVTMDSILCIMCFCNFWQETL